MRQPKSLINRFLSILIMLGLMAAGLNLACQSSSNGKSFIQICSASGIKTVEVEANGLPDGSGDNNPSKPLKTCAFCFAANIAVILPAIDVIKTVDIQPRNIFTLPAQQRLVIQGRYEKYIARAPPILA